MHRKYLVNNWALNCVVQIVSSDRLQRRLYHMQLLLFVHMFTSPTTLKAARVQGPRHFLLCIYLDGRTWLVEVNLISKWMIAIGSRT